MKPDPAQKTADPVVVVVVDLVMAAAAAEDAFNFILTK